jgi:hypothetical protein
VGQNSAFAPFDMISPIVEGVISSAAAEFVLLWESSLQKGQSDPINSGFHRPLASLEVNHLPDTQIALDSVGSSKIFQEAGATWPQIIQTPVQMVQMVPTMGEFTSKGAIGPY